MSYLPWFERWPELLEWELGRFAVHGLPAEVDEVERAQGRLLVHSSAVFEGETFPVEVRYPAESPELPPHVSGPPGLLGRHQHPDGGNFCLLANPDEWPASQWGAADLIAERLVALLRDSDAGEATVAANELPTAEPFSAYYSYPSGPVVLMPGDAAKVEGDAGSMMLRSIDAARFRFIVESIAGEKADPRVTDLFTSHASIKVRWKRVIDAPSVFDADAMVEWLAGNHPDLLPPKVAANIQPRPGSHSTKSLIVALTFEEEGPAVGEKKDAWLFVCLRRNGPPFFIHSQVVSLDERFRRIPNLAELHKKKVLVVGGGSLGGAVALELAKAGTGFIDLVDQDRYEVNNGVRHVLNIDYSGLHKASAVAIACRRANPFAQVRAHDLMLGRAQWDGQSSAELLEGLIGEVDLVVEATGSHQVQRYVGRVCRENACSLVTCWLTTGSLGAHVLRIVPNRTRSFLCAATALSDGSEMGAEAGVAEHVMPQGCSQPTTVGAGFDASEVAAVATRLAVQTLLGMSFRESTWDHAVMNFYRPSDDRTFPRFTTRSLAPHEDCVLCATAAG